MLTGPISTLLSSVTKQPARKKQRISLFPTRKDEELEEERRRLNGIEKSEDAMIRRKKFDGGDGREEEGLGFAGCLRQPKLDLIPPTLAICLYWNSLKGDFVHDDLSAITGNRDVIGSDPTNTDAPDSSSSWNFLYNDFWGASLLDPRSHKSYRPLTVLTFRWNFAASGLNPWSYHAVNVVLHAAVCWLLTRVCRLCFRLSEWTSLLAASLFAIHPIHTEAVSGIVGRADVLAAFFFLLSFICHQRATVRKCSPGPLVRFMLRGASLFSALLALAAKENGIACLPIIITWDLIQLGDDVKDRNPIKSFSRRMVKEKSWGFWAKSWIRCWKSWRRRLLGKTTIFLSVFATLVFLTARIGLQQGQFPLFSEQDNPAAFASSRKSRLLTLLYLPAFNMGLLLAPVTLSYDWQNGSIPLIDSWLDWRNLVSFFFYAFLAIGTSFSWIHRKRVILWSVAVMVWPMLPASNLLYPCGFVVAERLLYLPSLGYCLIVAVGLQWIDRRFRQPAAGIAKWFVFLAVATSLAAKTWTRNVDWSDRKSLFESGLRTLPNNAKMHYNYANVQKDDGRWDDAIYHYRKAIELWPNYASALNNLGTVLLAKAEETKTNDAQLVISLVEEAKIRFREAIKTHPHHVHAHYNLAVIYMQRNETDQAERLLLRCLQLNPQHREASQLLLWIKQFPLEGTKHHEMWTRQYGIQSISQTRTAGSPVETIQTQFSSIFPTIPALEKTVSGALNGNNEDRLEDPHRTNNNRWNQTV